MKNKDVNKKEFLQITQAEALAIRDFDDFFPDKYVSFPLDEFKSLGVAFSSLAAAFLSVSQGNGQGKVLYEATFPVAGKLAKAKDGSGLLGTIVNKRGIAGQARFHEVESVTHTAGNASMLFMALAIMTINKALNNISENQKEIISFLEVDKQTQLKADLIILSDIIEDYQYNWDNSQYCKNREMQVLDIKRGAEQNILFYREMIEKKTSKQSFIHLDTAKTLNGIYSKFRYYKLALYLYSFSSFLDIMLLENFDSSYLENVINKINNYSLQYNEFYKKSLEGIGKYASSSWQSRVLQGLTVAGKFAGEQIAKIPDKNNKIKIDDKLISGSDKLGKFNYESIEKTVGSFSELEDSGVEMFADKIRLIDKIYNEPLKIMFDNKNIYLSAKAI